MLKLWNFVKQERLAVVAGLMALTAIAIFVSLQGVQPEVVQLTVSYGLTNSKTYMREYMPAVYYVGNFVAVIMLAMAVHLFVRELLRKHGPSHEATTTAEMRVLRNH